MNGYRIEKVINKHTLALSTVAEKKYPYMAGRGRIEHTDLHDNIAVMQNYGLSVDEIGRLYVDFLSHHYPSKILASLRSTKGGAELEKVRRIIKKEIQKDTRDYFHRKTDNLRHQELKPDEIVPDLDAGIVQAEFTLKFKRTDTIESVVNTLLDDRTTCFQKIGTALIEGAERYDLKKGNIVKPHFYKLFLEYDSILRALKKQAENKATTII